MRDSKYSWQQMAKASFIGIATTTTFYLAKTTGLFSSWFSTEETSEALSFSRKRESRDTAVTTDSHLYGNNRLINAGQRRLLQQSGVIVANPIPDKIIEVNQQYTYPLDNVFSGNYTLLGAVENEKNSLPSWLSLQPNLLSVYQAEGSEAAREVALNGDILYLANFLDLKILNVSNASNPQLLSIYPQLAYGVSVSNNIALILTISSALPILDVSNASNPQLLSTYYSCSSCTIYGLGINGSTAFVGDNQGLKILDLSNASNPRLLANYSMPAGEITINGNIAYVKSAYLQIVDVSNLTNPRLLSTYNAIVTGIVFRNNIAFAAAGANGLQIFNVSDPKNLQLLGSYPILTDNAYEIALSGSTAFVAAGLDGLQIFDVSNLNNPRLIGVYPSGTGGAYGVTISDSTVFVADYTTGLQIIDVSRANLIGVPPSSSVGQQYFITVSARNMDQELKSDTFILTLDQLPRVITSTISDQSIYPKRSSVFSLSSEVLFVNPRNSFLKLSIRLSNGAITPSWLNLNLQPTLLSNVPTPVNYADEYAVTVNGSTVFALGIYLQTIDISNPSIPHVLSTYNSNGGTTITINGNTAFLGNRDLQIFDVSNLSNPQFLYNYAGGLGGNVYKILISGDKALVADYGSLQILDINNVSNPRLLSSFSDGGCCFQGVALSGTTAYIANYQMGLQILDVSNMSNPLLISSYPGSIFPPNPPWGAIAVADDTVFMAIYPMGMQILDVSNMSDPQLLYTYPTSKIVNAIKIIGNIAFVVDDTGLQILDVSNRRNPRLFGSHPGGSGGTAHDIAVSSNIGYLADGQAGLVILDFSQWQLIATPEIADVGNYRVQIIATDDLGGTAATQPFSIRVEGPPQFHGNISAQLAKIGQAFNYFVPQGLVTDPNFDSVVFSAILTNGQPLPSWLNFNSLSATFAGTPPSSAVGNMTIVLSVTDNIAGSVNTTFTIIINHIPVVNQRIPDQLMGIGLNNSLAVPSGTFSHPDRLPLTYSAQRSNGLLLPAWLLFNETSLVFNGQPNATAVGIVSVQVTAADSLGGATSTIFTLHVDNFPRIAQPVLASSASMNAFYQLSVANSFVDDDGDAMTYQATLHDGSLLPVWLSFNAYSLQFTGTPATGDVGTMAIRFSATDNWGGRTDQLFNLSVVTPPGVGVAIAQQATCTDQFFRFVVPSNAFIGSAGFSYSAQRSDGQPLPAWLNLEGITGTFSGTPTSTDAEQIAISLFCGGTSTDFNLIVASICPTLRNPILPRVTNVNTPFALTVAGDTFDNGGMALTLSARRADGSSLPNWLSFNPSTAVLAGVPLATDVGLQALQLIAVNPLGGQGAAPFNLTVCHFPTLVNALPTPSPLRAQRPFSLTIPPNTLTSYSGGPLQYQLQQADGSSFPSWLSFNASQLTLAGTPGFTDLGNFNLQILASDGSCGPTIVPLSLVVWPNYPPQVVHPLTNQIASVGAHFVFFVPSDTFTDRNNDTLLYTARQSNGHSLPSWLKFSASTLSFKGTPSRSDTGDFSDNILTIALTAHDDQSQTAANFNINVTGTSNLLLFIKIAVPIFSILTTAIGLYLQRGRLLNHCNPKRYQPLADYKVTIGETFEYVFQTPKEDIAAVRFRVSRETKGCCRFFQVPRQALPGGADLPHWMEYDPETNTLRSKGPIPNTKLREVFVQAKGSAERTLEQFTLHIEPPALLEEAVAQAGSEADISKETKVSALTNSGDIEMQTLHTSPPSMSF